MKRLDLVFHAVTASLAVALVLGAACGGTSPKPAPPPGPPAPTGSGAASTTAPADPAPSLRLSRNVEPLAYRATVRADPAQETFSGSIAIDVRITEPTATIWMQGHELEIDEASARFGDERVALTAAKQGEDLIGFKAPRALSGTWILEIRYRGKQETKGSTGLFRQLDEGDWYAFTQLEAIYARRVFPCFDEPDRKTPWTLTLEVPAALTAISNTLQVAEEPAAEAGWKRVSFAPTRPLPTYLVAFAIGPFEIAPAGSSRGGAPIRIITPRGKFAHARPAVEVVPRALALLEDYLDFPDPYDKLDFVPIPVTVGFGCMENPGMVTCVGEAMLFDPATETPSDRRSIAGAAAHELAHMWFGNLVTLAWWDDIWLNEGLATWIEYRIMHTIDPRPDDVFSVIDIHEWALGADSLATARAVRQPIVVADDILNVFDGISYGKAGAVMTMYERWVGPEAFQRGIRAYLKAHAFGNATTADFLAAMSKEVGKDLSGASTYLDQPGAPLLRIDLRCEAGKPPTLTIAQSRYLPPGSAVPAVASSPWQIPICVAHDKDGKRGETCTVLTGATAEVPLDSTTCPKWTWPNADGVGHYRVSMSPALVAQATGYGWSRMTPQERLVMASDLSAMTQAGDLDFGVGMSLVPRLMREGNRAAVETAAGFASQRQLVPAARMAAFDRWIVKQFGAEARRLGWLRKAGEPLDLNRRRGALVPLVAEAGDRKLRADAVKLARNWKELDREVRDRILHVAVGADGATFDRLLEAALVEQARTNRGTLHHALTGTRDPVRVGRVLELLLDDRVDVREVMWLPYRFGREPERGQVEAWIRAHLARLSDRIPGEGVTSSGSNAYAGIFANACDPARRDEVASFITEQFGKTPGGAREVAQAIEGMDKCIAYRAKMGPQVEAWAATLR